MDTFYTGSLTWILKPAGYCSKYCRKLVQYSMHSAYSKQCLIIVSNCFFVQMAECLLRSRFVGYKVIMGFSCFLWFLVVFVYIIFVISFKIRHVNRLPLATRFFVIKPRASLRTCPLQALLWALVVITDIALWVFGLSPAPTGAGSRRVYCESFGCGLQAFFEQYHT